MTSDAPDLGGMVTSFESLGTGGSLMLTDTDGVIITALRTLDHCAVLR
jgi:hypothetical protein